MQFKNHVITGLLAVWLIFTLTDTSNVNFAMAMPSNLTLANDCPASQPADQAGCSTCTECCIFNFNTAGCGEPSVEQLVSPVTTKCQPLIIGMYSVWITECTGWFAECYLWKNVDCSGNGSILIDNCQNVCHTPGYVIKAIQCYGI
ncbi:uncharacterized protein Z518_00414 [Rhinocladiella mackenziei CBS 650.93]|uniref:ShKT domain-containing protein n=1 Tax=Rhinocladiella mackenziei CBS 650.93 TaxID=1442369 RepID=A0A0D2JIT3_9EURO|nr:uncharacterized protein Z518_00414 [Rhinocladiella mackenziei CBS 650.93]KIX09335.1 hypothetical protein Z518_00414 [Rhinocladiella mackenziei CBS 650.93]